MYKILIHKPTLPKNTYVLYTELVEDVDELTGETTKTSHVWVGETMPELQDKYKQLLGTYTMAQMLAVDDLDVELDVVITDETDS